MKGKSTTIIVAQAVHDLFFARPAEAPTVVRCFRDLIDLYRLDGSLLNRRGIAAPDGEGLPAIGC